MNDPITNTGVRRITLGLLLGGLLLLAYSVLQLFLVPMAWAAIMAYATWPMYARLRRLLRGRATLSAALMSLLLMASFVLPLLWLVAIMRTELGSAYAAVAAYLAQGPRPLPDFVATIPWLGDWLQQLLDGCLATRSRCAIRSAAGWKNARANCCTCLAVWAAMQPSWALRC